MSARQAAPALHVSTVQPETAAKKGGVARRRSSSSSMRDRVSGEILAL